MDAQTSADSPGRGARSLARLQAEGIPTNPDLIAIEDPGDGGLRSPEDIAWRAMALLVVAGRADGLAGATVDRIIGNYGLGKSFTPAEAAFLRQASPQDRDRLSFVWRYEAAWTLLWALRHVEDLGRPSEVCDVSRAIGILQRGSAEQLVAGARLRPEAQILDEFDLIRRYHWAVDDALRNDRPVPASLVPEVIVERYRALSWLISYRAQAWDEVAPGL